MVNIVGSIRHTFANWRTVKAAKPPELHVAIMRAHRVQSWFIHHRGIPIFRGECKTCAKLRAHTIWCDGKYYCLSCLYAQVAEKRPSPIPMQVDETTMLDFSASWRAYRSRIENSEEPLVHRSSFVARFGLTSHTRSPPICEVGECETCEGLRPFMRREDGDAGCVYCLMKGRIVELEIKTAAEAAA